ncbi:hypothetical protein MSG28_006707 [Choristoneura fumiferana]|uniref:Uncharacterized protein n=1 Tax=Choristoneura fumiferana TaxID=7141 RepID=A0ACC0JKV9_CHOFU|nr:hypothetical protein MSG28_006707 [Choristoneura fumiferana]
MDNLRLPEALAAVPSKNDGGKDRASFYERRRCVKLGCAACKLLAGLRWGRSGPGFDTWPDGEAPSAGGHLFIQGANPLLNGFSGPPDVRVRVGLLLRHAQQQRAQQYLLVRAMTHLPTLGFMKITVGEERSWSDHESEDVALAGLLGGLATSRELQVAF